MYARLGAISDVTAEAWGQLTGAVVTGAGQIVGAVRGQPPDYFGAPPPVRVITPAPAMAMPAWLLPVGLAAVGGIALFAFTRR